MVIISLFNVSAGFRISGVPLLLRFSCSHSLFLFFFPPLSPLLNTCCLGTITTVKAYHGQWRGQDYLFILLMTFFCFDRKIMNWERTGGSSLIGSQLRGQDYANRYLSRTFFLFKYSVNEGFNYKEITENKISLRYNKKNIKDSPTSLLTFGPPDLVLYEGIRLCKTYNINMHKLWISYIRSKNVKNYKHWRWSWRTRLLCWRMS